MSSILIRNIDEETKKAIRLRAAERGVSMEQEARDILKAVARTPGAMRGSEMKSGEFWYASVRELVDRYGGFDLELPRREPMREPPAFD
ncbi:MAG: plasmid stabilization protein [Mesorhizobium sp.]